MPCTFTLATPMTLGTLAQPVTVSSLRITTLYYSSTPELAPLGTAELEVTLTDPVSGWQEIIKYQDADIMGLWDAPHSITNTGLSMGDVVTETVFTKLIADGKLPEGTLGPTNV